LQHRFSCLQHDSAQLPIRGLDDRLLSRRDDACRHSSVRALTEDLRRSPKGCARPNRGRGSCRHPHQETRLRRVPAQARQAPRANRSLARCPRPTCRTDRHLSDLSQPIAASKRDSKLQLRLAGESASWSLDATAAPSKGERLRSFLFESRPRRILFARELLQFVPVVGSPKSVASARIA